MYNYLIHYNFIHYIINFIHFTLNFYLLIKIKKKKENLFRNIRKNYLDKKKSLNII